MKYYIGIMALLLFASCDQNKNRVVEIETEYGNMKFELFNETPQHRDNFIKLAKEGFYDDLLFHRVINRFMIQGGDPQSKDAAPDQNLGGGGPGYKIPAEIGRKHFKGALSAARQGDRVNPEMQSSGSQFYIVQGTPVNDAMLNQIEQTNNVQYTEEERAKYKEVGGTPNLDGKYTVFGQIIEGEEIIDKIATVETSKNPRDRPVKDIKMKVKVVR